MNSRQIRAFALSLSLAVVAPLASASASDDSAPESSRPVDLVICLDTSGSMQGLIDAARQKLWTIVNDLALARPTPRLRVALLTFGNDNHDPAAGWVKLETGLTDDLDKVSEKLFEQTTNGGTELVGRVVQASLTQLEWSTHSDALKLIFVAGNESADQDKEVPFREACKRAIESGIMVNAIYCGPAADGLAPAWKEVALRADGHFATIDKDHGTVVINTPFDKELIGLNDDLNATYLPYGKAGAAGALNQRVQDSNAAGRNDENIATRARTKASVLYMCGWDLGDASRAEDFDWEKLVAKDLPEPMRKMTTEQREKYVADRMKQRGAVKKKIVALSKKRDTFASAEREKMSNAGDRAFDRAVRDAIRAQARIKGFRFPKSGAESGGTVPASDG